MFSASITPARNGRYFAEVSDGDYSASDFFPDVAGAAAFVKSAADSVIETGHIISAFGTEPEPAQYEEV